MINVANRKGGSVYFTSPSSQAASRPSQNWAVKFPFTQLQALSNASLGEETRFFRNGKTLTMNPVMALGMKVERSFVATGGTAHHTGDAVNAGASPVIRVIFVLHCVQKSTLFRARG